MFVFGRHLPYPVTISRSLCFTGSWKSHSNYHSTVGDPCLLNRASQVSSAAHKSSSPGVPLDARKEMAATTAFLNPSSYPIASPWGWTTKWHWHRLPLVLPTCSSQPFLPGQLHSFESPQWPYRDSINTTLGWDPGRLPILFHSSLSGVHLIWAVRTPQPILPAHPIPLGLPAIHGQTQGTRTASSAAHHRTYLKDIQNQCPAS